MKIKITDSFFLWLFFGLLFVASSASAIGETKLTVEMFDKVRLGSDIQAVQKTLGTPAAKFRVKAHDGDQVKSEIWAYREKMNLDGQSIPLDRLTLEFDAESKVLIGKTFVFNLSDQDASFHKLERRYSGKLKFEEASFCGHYKAGDDAYVDYSIGLRLTKSSRKDKVQSISRWIPENKKPASEREACGKPASYIEEIALLH